MHFATDPLGPQYNGETYISRAKVSSTVPNYKRRGEPHTDVKTKTLRERITDKMPAWRKTVDNRSNGGSANSMVTRATAAKDSPSKAQVKSYHY